MEMNGAKCYSSRREREQLSPETLQEMMKFLCDAPEYCATWRENGNFYGVKKTRDGQIFHRRNGNPVCKRALIFSAKRVIAEHWEVVHYAVE